MVQINGVRARREQVGQPRCSGWCHSSSASRGQGAVGSVFRVLKPEAWCRSSLHTEGRSELKGKRWLSKCAPAGQMGNSGSVRVQLVCFSTIV